MSVWEATTYKLDIAKHIYEYLNPFHETILGPTVGCFLQPRGDLVPFDMDDAWSTVADECNWQINDEISDSTDKITTLIHDVQAWSVGLGAVYKLIFAVYKGKFEVQPQYKYRLIDARARALASVVAPSTMITVKQFIAEWNRVDPELLKLARIYEDFSEAWKFMVRGMNCKEPAYKKLKQETYFGDGDRFYYGGTVGPLLILVGSGSYRSRGLILTRNHLNILIEASARIAGILDHTAREHAQDGPMKSHVLTILSMTIEAGGMAKKFNVDKVCQAFHKARSYVQMIMFDNVMKSAREEALLEFQKKGLQNIINLGKYVNMFLKIEKGRWLELLHIYKWMPPPDYDATYAFTELQEYHNSRRPSGLDPESSREIKELWRLVEKERKLNIAVTYRRINGSWPKDLLIEDDFPNEESLDVWTPYELFPYFIYGTDVTNQIKDKTTVLSRMEDEVRDDVERKERNFLLWYLNNRNTIDTGRYARQLSSGGLGEDNYVRVAYKGEAHKPGSRLFFMAPPKQRILLGELEGNIARLARYYPASLQGMDALARAERLGHLFDVDDHSFVQSVTEPYTSYVVTFDLSKFSSQFNPAILKNLHKFWAAVFAYPPIEAMVKIGAESEILHTTNNLIMHYPNVGADLEGFRGRMMTLFHADLISAACRHAHNLGYIVGKAVCLVFIDDGAVRIAAKGEGPVARANALQFLECMKAVYESAGQENHPNKTIVSCLGGELLAEQYLAGQRLKCPIKAGMRLYPSYDSPASSITEEFDSLFASIQGSVRDGCKWTVAYRRLADAYIKAIFRWERRRFDYMNDLQFALKLVTPKSFGGFGFPSLQSLVSTTAYNTTIEGLGILNSAGRSVVAYQEQISRILDRSVVIRDPLHILRNGERVRMEGDILIEGRLVDKILQALGSMPGPARDLVRAYTSEELVNHARAVAVAVLGLPTVSLPVLKRLWDCTPLAYIESIVQKFKRSASIKMIIGEEGVTQIRRANRRDVRKLVSTFF